MITRSGLTRKNCRRLLVLIPLVLWISCAYFNTFYNAQHYFREAKKTVTNDTLKVDSENFDKTIEKATSVIVKYPHSRYVDDALFMMGVSYYYKGDYARALEKLDYILYNYSDSKYYDDALYYRGLAYFKEQKYGQAVIDLKEAKEFKPFRSRAGLVLCQAYFATKNYTDLTAAAGQMMKEHLNREERRWILSILGDAQFQQELFDDALETYNKLLSLTSMPDDKQALKLRIAEIYLAMGEYAKCRDFLEGEYDPEFRNIFAELTATLGDTLKAKEIYLEVAVSGFSDIAAQAFFQLAELYRAQDSLDMAIVHYDSALYRSAISEYGSKAKKMAEVLRRINLLAGQSEDLDRAQFMRAEIYYIDFNDPDRASQEYRKVYKDFPASIWAPKALYARFWINHTVIKNDSIARECAQLLTQAYPRTEYALSARTLMGWDGSQENEETETPDMHDEPIEP
ncbi:tetratricopeptide repeat protein [candidate division WOR-3 bacterium]|nr:tetratricopeptide repeat protein [candidate division WOR-3 bacterium]